ncbi:hypothetical protein F5876DRAFT_80604 [Lentinula aff. lateritia]|uniref:Uncharacterized protein n=1 Tax=Lentinula aff. lateritia TaxID=2804960 RepID=A0ACC1TPA0_9AGAR|nr:hypothetical protein F5876DRAFT_80604 [Lentinula aff. lateritia]
MPSTLTASPAIQPSNSSPVQKPTSLRNAHTYPPTNQSPSSHPSPSSPLVSAPRMNRSSSSPSKTTRPAVVNVASNLIVKIRQGAHAMSHIPSHHRRTSDASSHSSSSSSEEEKVGGEAAQRMASPIKNITQRNYSTWRCSSGSPRTLQTTPDHQTEPFTYKDTFVCSGGVNLPLLLRMTKVSLVEVIESRAGIGMGFGSGKKVVLDSEKWTCRISGPPVQPVSPPSTPTSATSTPISKPASPSLYPSYPSKRLNFDTASASTSKTSITLSPTKTHKNVRKFTVHIHYYASATIVASAGGSPMIGKSECNQPVALDRAREGSIQGLMTILSRREPKY